MDAKDFAERFSSYRRENGLTQEDVADYLGVTKAAVSKWECGHSFPDMTLMPEIASLFAISIDDLFGYSTHMDQSKIEEIAQAAMALFATEPEQAMEYVRAQAKAHWSCSELLRALALVVYSQVPQKPGFDRTPVEGEAHLYASEAERLFERIVQLNGAESLSFGDAVSYATVLQWLGKGDQARSLVEPMVSQEPNLASLSFAQLLDAQGDGEEAIRVLQRGLLFSLIESSNILQMLASMYGDDDERRSAVYELARQLTDNKEYLAISPTMMPIITMAMAESAARRGRKDEALGYLHVFVDDLNECCKFMKRPLNPVLFDEVSDLMWKEDDADLQAASEESVTALRRAYRSRLMTDEVWKGFADSAEFREIVSAIGADHE